MNAHDYFRAPGRVGCHADETLMARLNAARLDDNETIDEVVRRLLCAGLGVQR